MSSLGFKLDEKDKKIITLLTRDPDMSQDAIADKISLSQPSVALRLKKLREKGVVETLCGMDPLKMGLSLAKVDIITSNTTKVLESLRKCPYFLNGYILSGKFNMCLFFIGEDVGTLEAIVDCHLRRLDHIQRVEFNIIVGVSKDMVVPMKLNITRADRPPCGIEEECKDCPVYGIRCSGCPVTGYYTGKLW